MRVLPHFQDTGGFFIAVMKKVKEVPWVTCRQWSDTPTDKTASKGANTFLLTLFCPKSNPSSGGIHPLEVSMMEYIAYFYM